jgi:hypothetical protein
LLSIGDHDTSAPQGQFCFDLDLEHELIMDDGAVELLGDRATRQYIEPR